MRFSRYTENLAQFFSQGTKGNLLVADALLDLCISQHHDFQFSAMSTQRDPDRPDAVPGTVHYEQPHGLEPESYTSRKLVCVLRWLLLSIAAKKANNFLVSWKSDMLLPTTST